MNVRFELNVIENSVNTYDQMIEQSHEILKAVENLKNGMSDDVWSGEGREAFDQAVTDWILRTKVVISEIVQTREGLACAGNKGNEMKGICEAFGQSY